LHRLKFSYCKTEGFAQKGEVFCITKLLMLDSARKEMPEISDGNGLVPAIDSISVRWRNFRGFTDTGRISLKPVTILLGPNNSGKTSFLAPFLLLKETINSRVPWLGLKMVGEGIDVGSFEEIAHDHKTDIPVSFEITFHSHDNLSDHVPPPAESGHPGRLVVEFLEGEDDLEVSVHRYAVYDAEGRVMLNRARLDSGRYSLTGLKKMVQGSGKRRFDKDFDKRVRKFMAIDEPINFLFTDNPFTRAIREIDLPDPPGALSPYSSSYLSIVETVSGNIRAILDNVTFIGPLRKRPSRLYIKTNDFPATVGSEGENAAEIIYRWNLITDEFTGKIEEWLRHFDFNVKVVPKTITKDVFSMELKERRKGGCRINFADAGFGISQVLPLIVQCVFAKEFHKIIITEQPEIHLNPKLQALLADLFVDVANAGSAVLIETHSEHLVLRLRRLIAEERIQADSVGLYYVEKIKGNSVIREVPIDELGHIADNEWPEGFFETALDEAIGLSTAQSKRVSKHDVIS
jgi:predicted ATPase